MKKLKNNLKIFFLIIIILLILILYKEHEKNKINKINSFDFIIINLSIKNNDKITLKYKFKKNKILNKKIDQTLLYNYNIKKIYNLTHIKKKSNNKKINILKK